MPVRLAAMKDGLFTLARRHEDTLARGLLAAVGLVLAGLLLLDPATILHRHFPSDRPPPDRAYVARKVHSDFAATAPDVLILGGSSMREMIAPPGPDGKAPPGLCTGSDRLFNAATSSQEPADSYAVLDALPRPPGLVVVGLTARRLIGDRRDDPYALHRQVVELPRSTAAARDALRHGRFDVLGFDFFDQLGRAQWTLQTVALTARGMTWQPDPQIDDRSAYPSTPLPAGDKRLVGDKLLLRAEVPGGAQPAAIDAYWLAFADHAVARGGKGTRVLFVFTPTSTEAAAHDTRTAPLVDAALRRIAARYPILDLRDETRSAPASDFYDPLHVSHAGRDRLWPPLAAAIRAAQSCASGL